MNNNDVSVSNIIQLADDNNILHSVMIEIDTICNWQCKHCYIPEHNYYGRKKEEIKKLLDKLRGMGVYEITYTGGEIFCRNDMMELVEYSRELGFNVVLFTNMSMLTEKDIKKLSDLYVSLISCTIFSMDSKIHDSITGKYGSLDKVLENISIAKKYGINIEIKTIVMKENLNTFLSVYNFCIENDFLFKPDVAVFSKTDGDKNNQKSQLSLSEMTSVIDTVDKLVGYESLDKTPNDYVCPSIRHSISIDAYGYVNPCNRIPIRIGNVYSEEIRELWEDSKELAYVKGLMWKDLKDCSLCDNNKYCVRCAGAALVEDGGILNKSSLACNIACARKTVYES